jgi:hypothetical protein
LSGNSLAFTSGQGINGRQANACGLHENLAKLLLQNAALTGFVGVTSDERD